MKNKILKFSLIASVYSNFALCMEQMQNDNSCDEVKQKSAVSFDQRNSEFSLDNLPKEIIYEIITFALDDVEFSKVLKTVKAFEKIGRKYRNIIYNDEIKKILTNLQEPLNTRN